MATLRNPPPTYKAITTYCMERFSFEPKTCWIADVKKRMGYDVKPAPNRQGEERACPCPEDKLKKLTEAIMKA